VTTADERRQAVTISRRVLDASEPLMLDVGEMDVLARTILDCSTAFTRMAPVYAAALEVVSDEGWMRGAVWQRFARLVLEAKAHEAKAHEAKAVEGV
jgi:hypothetical protein